MEYYMPDYAEEGATRPLGYFFTNKEEAEKFVKEHNEKALNIEVHKALKTNLNHSYKFIGGDFYVTENGQLFRKKYDKSYKHTYVPTTKEEIISIFISYESDGYCILMELNSFEGYKN